MNSFISQKCCASLPESYISFAVFSIFSLKAPKTDPPDLEVEGTVHTIFFGTKDGGQMLSHCVEYNKTTEDLSPNNRVCAPI